jgi:hypothetical protein
LSIHCIYYKYVLTKQNPQPCKNECGTKIYLSDKKQKGRYLPYELDDSIHDCPKKPTNGLTTGAAVTITANSNKLPTIKELDARLRKLESIILGNEE